MIMIFLKMLQWIKIYFLCELFRDLIFINLQVNIMENGEVCLEFVKQKQKVEKVMEVFVISPDGMGIKIYQPNHGKGEPIQDHPLPLPESPSKQFSFDELPEKYWKKYQYAARLVMFNHFDSMVFSFLWNIFHRNEVAHSY